MLRKYRLLQGSHIGLDADGKEQFWEAARLGHAGNPVIETHQDLDSLNGRGMSPKFMRIQDETPQDEAGLLAAKADIDRRLAEIAKTNAAKTTAPTLVKSKADTLAALDKMNPAELKQFAEDRELEIGNATTKDQLLAAIKKQV